MIPAALLARLRFFVPALALAGCSAWANFGDFTVTDGGADVDAGPVVDAGCGAACVSGIAQLEAGDFHFCALRGGEVWCWGVNDERQVSSSETVYFDEPQLVDLPRDAVAIDATLDTSCAVLDDGRLFCWGENRDRIPAAPSTLAVPTDVGLVDVARVGLGEDHACVARLDETVTCWGDNDAGQLGQGDTSEHTGFVDVTLGPVTSIASGDDHTCARLSDGTVRCWGENITRGAGNTMSQVDFLEPGPRIQTDDGGALVDLTDVAQVSCQDDGCCATTDAATGRGVYCWGTNRYGQSGLEPSFTATDDGNRGDAVRVVDGLSSGVDRHFAVCAEVAGDVFCWGNTEYGQLGDGVRLNEESRITPMVVDGLTGVGVEHIAMSSGVACAATSSDVLCWGTVRAPPPGGGVFEEVRFDATPTTVPFAE